jgi:hypothetical protein
MAWRQTFNPVLASIGRELHPQWRQALSVLAISARQAGHEVEL